MLFQAAGFMEQTNYTTLQDIKDNIQSLIKHVIQNLFLCFGKKMAAVKFSVMIMFDVPVMHLQSSVSPL